jgi:uncharacterized protein YjbJ (UPF0337 family)
MSILLLQPVRRAVSEGRAFIGAEHCSILAGGVHDHRGDRAVGAFVTPKPEACGVAASGRRPVVDQPVRLATFPHLIDAIAIRWQWWEGGDRTTTGACCTRPGTAFASSNRQDRKGGRPWRAASPNELKGRVKEAAGALTGDDELKREGQVDQAAGKIKQAVEKVVDKVKDALG